MTEPETIISCVCDSLTRGGVEAVITKNPPGGKKRHTRPIVTVGLKAGSADVGGRPEYLGVNLGTGVELYGRRLELTLGLGLWSPKEGENSHEVCLRLFSQVAGALDELPESVKVKELVCGETVYDPDAEMFKCGCELKVSAYLVAEREPDSVFLDFKLKGVITS